VRRYNDLVAKGVDEDFGRDGLSTHYGKLVTIETAPFYAYPSTSGLIATYCGLTVDPRPACSTCLGSRFPGFTRPAN